jgi:hypothetical protein
VAQLTDGFNVERTNLEKRVVDMTQDLTVRVSAVTRERDMLEQDNVDLQQTVAKLLADLENARKLYGLEQLLSASTPAQE